MSQIRLQVKRNNGIIVHTFILYQDVVMITPQKGNVIVFGQTSTRDSSNLPEKVADNGRSNIY